MANTPYKQTNDAVNKSTQELAEMRSEVLGIVNALTNSHKEILTNINQNQDLPSINSCQISSISNSEKLNNINNKNRDIQKLILQLENKIDKLKPQVNKTMEPQVHKTNNWSYKQATPYIMQCNCRKKNTNHYCWTYGSCAYQSSECKHQAQVTNLISLLKIKKGGSIDFYTGKWQCGIDVCNFFKSHPTNKYNKKIYTSVIPPHQQTCNITTKGDSAASNHYFTMRDKNTSINVRPNNPPTLCQTIALYNQHYKETYQ